MQITNKRGNITFVQFTQVEPTPDPNNALTNLFPLISGTVNQYLNMTKTVDLNAATINNYAVGTKFKVKAEVRNDCGDKSVGYTTFILSSTPIIGDATVSCPSSPCRPKETMTVTLTGSWYSTNAALMELYIKVELRLSDGTTVLVVPEKWQQTSFAFAVPVLSSTSNSALAVDVLITATNIYDKAAIVTKSITVNNTLASGYRSSLYSIGVDYTSLDNIVLLGSQMRLTLAVPSN